ncbi:hypothetical protein VRK_27370 [Vibrio sp. MEBiC08052]|nr:hypothetical protein VRK_27370 [Vibrio sp. MEBiC08052]
MKKLSKQWLLFGIILLLVLSGGLTYCGYSRSHSRFTQHKP